MTSSKGFKINLKDKGKCFTSNFSPTLRGKSINKNK